MENLSLNDNEEVNVHPRNPIGNTFTKLHLAAAKGNVKEIIELIDSGCDVNVVVPTGLKKGCTPLHLATEFKHLDAMKTLLGKGADFTLKNADKETPLQIARNIDWKEAIELIINAFCTVCSKINENIRAIFEERKLVTDFDINVSEKFRENFEPISFAVQCGLEGIVIILINHGFDVEARDSNGMTELHRVVQRITEFKVPDSYEMGLRPSPHSDFLNQMIIRLFMTKYKDIKDPADNYGRTPIFYLYKGLPERKLCQQFSSGVMIRMCWSRVYLLQQMLQTPALSVNLHKPDYEGNTILHTVAEAPLSSYPYIEASIETSFIVEQYLTDGGDIDALNSAGYTPLHCCSQQSNVKVALVFLKSGADINAVTPQGDTPYSILCKSEFAWTFERLIMFSYIKRLVILGVPLCSVNARLYERDNEIWLNAAEDVKRTILPEDKCNAEVESMKTDHIDDFTTVYDILHKTVHEVVNHTRNERLVSRDFIRTLPIFGYLLKNKINKAKVRAELLEPAKEALLDIVKFEFPDACLHAILAHFKNDDLKELIKLEIDEKK